MKRYSKRLLLVIGLFLSFGLAVHAEFIRQVGISGGAARELYNTLQRTGYQGQPGLDELMICNKKTNSANMWYGYQSSMDSASGNVIEPGACVSWRAGFKPINTTQIFIYVASTQNMEVTLRER